MYHRKFSKHYNGVVFIFNLLIHSHKVKTKSALHSPTLPENMSHNSIHDFSEHSSQLTDAKFPKLINEDNTNLNEKRTKIFKSGFDHGLRYDNLIMRCIAGLTYIGLKLHWWWNELE